MFSDEGGEQIKVVAEDQIRRKACNDFIQCLQEGICKLPPVCRRHITVTGAFIGHFIRHAKNGKR